jgi:hypothetical protein
MRRFHGSVRLDPVVLGGDIGTVAEEVGGRGGLGFVGTAKVTDS